MFRLSRQDNASGDITHAYESDVSTIAPEKQIDWQKWGDFTLVVDDITQELADKAQKEQDAIDARARIEVADVAAVTTIPALRAIVEDLVKIVKG